ncbi:MAG: Clp protease N-terminal domain-containing protein [Acidimicrobiia bacterium]
MLERLTEQARRVVVLAQEEARLLDHSYIGSEHLLLALLNENEGVVARAFLAHSLDLPKAREAVETIIGRGSETPQSHIPFTRRAKKVMEYSLREAIQVGHRYIGAEPPPRPLARE